MDHPPAQPGRQTHNQFQLLGVMVLAGAMDSSTRGIYTQLAPAVFILPYFLFSATAGEIAATCIRADQTSG